MKYIAVIAIILIGTLFLGGCWHTKTRSVYYEPERAKTSGAAKDPCKDPIEIPSRDLTEDETGEGWGHDRAALYECSQKNKVLVQSISVLERRK